MKKQTAEEKLEKIKKMLSQNNGQVDEELKKEIQSFTREKREEQIKEITKQSSSPYNSQQAISDLGEIETPDIVKDSIKKTISSMLDPLRTTFSSEIARYPDAISTQETIAKKIKRSIKAKEIKKIENGKFVPSVTGDAGEKYVINPEFKQLLSTGYKPSDDREYEAVVKEYLPLNPDAPGNKNPFFNLLIGAKHPEIGTPESEYIKNYLGGDKPAERKEEIRIIKNNAAGVFNKSFTGLTDNIIFKNNNSFKEIVLSGYSIQDLSTKNLKFSSPNQVKQPNWKISYKEAGTKYFLNIDNNFEFFSKNKTIFDTSSYYFIGELGSSSLNQSAKDLLNSINPERCNVLDNKELYSELNSTSFDLNIFKNSSSNSINNLRNLFNIKYDDALSSFISNFFSSYGKDRLLKEFKLPKINGLETGDFGSSSDLIIFNLLNFIPEASQELIDCGKQPHPLNLDLVIDLMTKKFNSMGVEVMPKKDFCNPNSSQEPKNPITEAAGIGATLIFLRLCVLENLLKGLFVLDEHQYSFDILDSSLLTDYIYIKTIEELEKYNLAEDIKNIVEENYDFFKDNLKITEQDENDSSTIQNIIVNKQRLTDLSPELKNLIKHLMRRSLGFLKNLIGTQSSEEKIDNLLLEKVSNNKIYELINDQTLDFSNDNEISSSRFSDILEKDEKDFMCLERFIDSTTDSPFKSGLMSQTQFDSMNENYRYVRGYVSLQTYDKFLQDVLNETTLIVPEASGTEEAQKIAKLDYFLNKPKIGIRLVQNWLVDKELSWSFIKEKLNDDKTSVNQKLKNKIQEFSISQDVTLMIKEQVLKHKKMFSFYDINLEKNNINYYNSNLICEKKIELTFREIINNKIDSNNLFNTKKQELLGLIVEDARYQLLTKKCFFLDKLPNLALLYSHSALSNSQTNSLFDGSKKRIFNLYDAAVNIKNYKYKNETDKKGGSSKKYQDDLANIGNPNGGLNLDVLQFLITTPILILKGLTELMDPNIAIASKIVNAASAGLLFPKLNENGQPIGYPGDKIILPTALASMALLPVNILAPVLGALAIGPPVTPLPGMLYWALEPLLWKLPFYQNQAANSDAAKKLTNDPENKGLKIGSTDNFVCDKDQDE